MSLLTPSISATSATVLNCSFMLRFCQSNRATYCAKAQFPSVFRNACKSSAIVLIVPVRVQPGTAPRRNYKDFLQFVVFASQS